MSLSTCSRAAGLFGLALFVLASVPRWPALSAADAEPEVELKLVEGGQDFTNSVGMKLVIVRAGKFDMGAPQNEQGATADERPQHKVELTRDFYLGVTEVTQKQFEKVMGKNGSAFSKNGSRSGQVNNLNTDDFPADNVNYDDALAFVQKLNALAAEKNAGRKYRLPTEAEWEYACRGGHKIARLGEKAQLPFQFEKPSASLGDGQANFDGNPYGDGKRGTPLNRPCKVASYEANALGIYDMHGNVWEWCSDFFAARIYNEKDRKDPTGPNNGGGRVLRGGSWGNSGSDCRAARQISYGGNNRSEHVGFRVACSR